VETNGPENLFATAKQHTAPRRRFRLRGCDFGGCHFPVPASENAMKIKMLESSGYELSYRLRMPAEPTLPPIQEPPTPPENPDMPLREPDPDMPNQI